MALCSNPDKKSFEIFADTAGDPNCKNYTDFLCCNCRSHLTKCTQCLKRSADKNCTEGGGHNEGGRHKFQASGGLIFCEVCGKMAGN